MAGRQGRFSQTTCMTAISTLSSSTPSAWDWSRPPPISAAPRRVSRSSSAGSSPPPAASSRSASRASMPRSPGATRRRRASALARRIEASAPVLSADDLAFWEEHGYVVLHDAVPPATREAAAQALWDHLGARADEPRNLVPPQRPRHHGAIFPAPGLRSQPPWPTHPQGLRALVGHRRPVGDHRPRRLQRAGARGLQIPRPASALGRQCEDADPVRHRRHSLSH